MDPFVWLLAAVFSFQPKLRVWCSRKRWIFFILNFQKAQPSFSALVGITHWNIKTFCQSACLMLLVIVISGCIKDLIVFRTFILITQGHILHWWYTIRQLHATDATSFLKVCLCSAKKNAHRKLQLDQCLFHKSHVSPSDYWCAQETRAACLEAQVLDCCWMLVGETVSVLQLHRFISRVCCALMHICLFSVNILFTAKTFELRIKRLWELLQALSL